MGGSIFANASEGSNLVQINLIDLSEKQIGAPNFVYGFSEITIPSAQGEGYTYDPAKMEWEVREDGVYIYGFWQDPETYESDETDSGRCGFFIVDLDGNGHKPG